MTKADLRLFDFMTENALRRLVESALEEDLGRGDVTSDSLIPPDAAGRAIFRSRDQGVIAGLDVAKTVFHVVDAQLQFTALRGDGTAVVAGQEIGVVSGAARSLLRGERVALNFLQRLSGIATLTNRYVEAVRGTQARVVDTRKTTPGLRSLEKYAVRAGGGFNHRRDLSDSMLIKDNHLVVIKAIGLSLAQAVKQARESMPHTLKVEIEVDDLDQIPQALSAGADIILLDNMSTDGLRRAVALIGSRAITEASGGVTLGTISEIAATGVDVISVGALTHSAPALDIGLDFEAGAEQVSPAAGLI
ncbi:MAG TPA: carboxylating nicotinate-nucleotide diphosphorylase [Blastocatellia bacterium]|nr:carboxylating nicotinate-nucleotide diphosphorylase [Blastocatellia bacterium]